LNVGSLFAGIGGFDLGFERCGMHTVWQVEQNAYCQAVLARHFPDARRFDDVRDVGAHCLDQVDVVCGGPPCQPTSYAGAGLAEDDERWLWPEFFRILGELRPDYAVMENPTALLGRGMGIVLGGLAEVGYDAEWACISAADMGAPHLRQRVWIVAYPGETGCSGGPEPDGPQAEGERPTPLRQNDAGCADPVGGRGDATHGTLADPDEERRFGGARVFREGWWRQLEDRDPWPPEPDLARVAHGVPDGTHRIAALGNALVPQIAEWIGRRILEFEEGGIAA
jgi:DNA (cytosine-5)-methyltransferase 1